MEKGDLIDVYWSSDKTEDDKDCLKIIGFGNDGLPIVECGDEIHNITKDIDGDLMVTPNF